MKGSLTKTSSCHANLQVDLFLFIIYLVQILHRDMRNHNDGHYNHAVIEWTKEEEKKKMKTDKTDTFIGWGESSYSDAGNRNH
jgi:hypothetical protein